MLHNPTSHPGRGAIANFHIKRDTTIDSDSNLPVCHGMSGSGAFTSRLVEAGRADQGELLVPVTGGFSGADVDSLCQDPRQPALADADFISPAVTARFAATPEVKYDRATWELFAGPRASDISVGADGSVWFLGDGAEDGDYRIYKRVGSSSWTHVTGLNAKRIAVGPDGDPWVVQNDGDIYRRAGGTWTPAPGRARDIAVGANGAVWCVGWTPVGGGYGILRWTGTDWDSVGGSARKIAVDPAGNPWIVGASGAVYRWIGSIWEPTNGHGTDIAIGSNGAVWILGASEIDGDYRLYAFVDQTAWIPVTGGGGHLAAGPQGYPWVTNANHEIRRLQP